MSPHGRDLLKSVFLVACGAGAGALAGGFVASNAPERRQAESQMRERIVELERRLEVVREQAPRRRRHVAEPEEGRIAAVAPPPSSPDGSAAPGAAGAESEEAPVVRKTFRGLVNGWTPSLDSCFERGGRYAWSVRAVDDEAS